MLERIKINEIVNKIAGAVRPKKIILFGSYAQKKATEDSDLDLLVVVDKTDVPKNKRAGAIRKHLWGMTDTPKDIIVYTEQELNEWAGVKASFVSDILKHGKVLYEN